MKMKKKHKYLTVNILLVESCITHKMKSFRKYLPPPPPGGGPRQFKGVGESKRRQFPRGWEVAYSAFFYSFSVEQAFSYFTRSVFQSKCYCLH